MAHIALIGGGRAAAACARKLRACGFDGQLSIFCAENHLPYDRPPLSKSYLKSKSYFKATGWPGKPADLSTKIL